MDSSIGVTQNSRETTTFFSRSLSLSGMLPVTTALELESAVAEAHAAFVARCDAERSLNYAEAHEWMRGPNGGGGAEWDPAAGFGSGAEFGEAGETGAPPTPPYARRDSVCSSRFSGSRLLHGPLVLS